MQTPTGKINLEGAREAAFRALILCFRQGPLSAHAANLLAKACEALLPAAMNLADAVVAVGEVQHALQFVVKTSLEWVRTAPTKIDDFANMRDDSTLSLELYRLNTGVLLQAGPTLRKLRNDFKEWEGKLNLLQAEYADQLKRLSATDPEAPPLVERLIANVERGGDRFPQPFARYLALLKVCIHPTMQYIRHTNMWFTEIAANLDGPANPQADLRTLVVNQLYSCPVLEMTEQRWGADILYRRIGGELVEGTHTADVVETAFGEAPQPRVLVCAARMSSGQTVLPYTREHMAAAEEWRRYTELRNAITRKPYESQVPPSQNPTAGLPPGGATATPTPHRPSATSEAPAPTDPMVTASADCASGGPTAASDENRAAATSQRRSVHAHPRTGGALPCAMKSANVSIKTGHPVNSNPLYGCVPMCVTKEIHAYGGDPPESVPPRKRVKAEVTLFVPIPFSPISDGTEASEPAGQGERMRPNLRPKTPPPVRDGSPSVTSDAHSPSKYWREAAGSEQQTTSGGPEPSAANTTTEPEDSPAEKEFLTPPAPVHTPTPPVAPQAPAPAARGVQEGAPRRRCLDLEAGDPDPAKNPNRAWAADPQDSIWTGNCSNRICFDWNLNRGCSAYCSRFSYRHACQRCGESCQRGDGRFDCSRCRPAGSEAPPRSGQAYAADPPTSPLTKTELVTSSVDGAYGAAASWMCDQGPPRPSDGEDVTQDEPLVRRENFRPVGSQFASPPEPSRQVKKGSPPPSTKAVSNAAPPLMAVDIARQVQEERSRGGPSRYTTLATDNLSAVLADPYGARCFHCCGAPRIYPDSTVIDGGTLLCPLCGVDAVVPASKVAEDATLHAWRFLAFYPGTGHDVPQEMIEKKEKPVLASPTKKQPTYAEVAACPPSKGASEASASSEQDVSGSPTQPEPQCRPLPTCKLEGCNRPCYPRPEAAADATGEGRGGSWHDYCGRTHAQRAIAQRRAPNPDAPRCARDGCQQNAWRRSMKEGGGYHRCCGQQCAQLLAAAESQGDMPRSDANESQAEPMQLKNGMRVHGPLTEESLSHVSEAGSLPAAYLDTRPFSVAFQGPAQGATVVFVSGATAPIEQGGHGLQANQDIKIDASRVQAYPSLVKAVGPHYKRNADAATSAGAPTSLFHPWQFNRLNWGAGPATASPDSTCPPTAASRGTRSSSQPQGQDGRRDRKSGFGPKHEGWRQPNGLGSPRPAGWWQQSTREESALCGPPGDRFRSIPPASSPKPLSPTNDVQSQWFTGLAKVVNAHEGVITEKRPSDGVYGSRLTFELHPYNNFGHTVSEHWVAFRKDPIHHPGRALSVVRLILPNPLPGWTQQEVRPAHRPPPPHQGRTRLPPVSLTDSLPTVQMLFGRYYGSDSTEPARKGAPTKAGLALDLAYAGSPGDPPPERPALSRFSGIKCKEFPAEFEHPILSRYGRICETGPSYPYGGQAVACDPPSTWAPPYSKREGGAWGASFGGELQYYSLLEYMLACAPPSLFSQINLKAIFFVKDLTYYGSPAPTLAVPSEGVILVDLHEARQSLSMGGDLPKALTYKVSRVLHELGHLCDYAIDPEGFEKPDPMLHFVLPDHQFPSRTFPTLRISGDTRGRLPNNMLYAAISPEEFRAEALADLWISQGALGVAQEMNLAYWDARARGSLPALSTMLKEGFKARGTIPARVHPLMSLNQRVLAQYKEGYHRETTPISLGVEALARRVAIAETRRRDARGETPQSEPQWRVAYAGDPVDLPLWRVRENAGPSTTVVELKDLAAGQDQAALPGCSEQAPMSMLASTPPSSAASDGSDLWREEEGPEDDQATPIPPSSPKMTGAANRLARRELRSSKRVGEADAMAYQPKWVWRQNAWDHEHGLGHGNRRVLVAAAVTNHAHGKKPEGPAARGKGRVEPRGCAKAEKRDRSPVSLRSRLAIAEHSFLSTLEEKCASHHTPPCGLSEVTVHFDVRGEPRAQRHKIKLDLDEQAALLLYRVVLQIVGHVGPKMLSWRLLGGSNQISFDTMDTGRGIGLQAGNHYALISRMRGGSDQPPHSEEERQVGAPVMPQAVPEPGATMGRTAEEAETPQPFGPGATPNPTQGADRQTRLPADGGGDPIDVSPPYRPMEAESGGGAPSEEAPPAHFPRLEAIPPPPEPTSTPPAESLPQGTPAAPRYWSGEEAEPGEDQSARAEAQRLERFHLEERIEAEIQARIRAELQASDLRAELQASDLRAELRASEMQRRLTAAAAAATEATEEDDPQYARDRLPAETNDTQPQAQVRDVWPGHSRSVNFGSAARCSTSYPGEEPASFPHRPRSERPAGTESRWQHYDNGGPEGRWRDEPAVPSRQRSPRGESPPPPDFQDAPHEGTGAHTPVPSEVHTSRYTSATSAQAARRGASGSTFSQPDDGDVAAQEDSLSFWEAEESTTFTDAPSTAMMERYFERHHVDPAVVELVARVRRQPWQANCASPHTNCFNPNLERPPLRQNLRVYNTMKKLSETRVSQKDFKFFNDPLLTAPTEHEQLHTWIQVRAEICITLRQCVDTRCAGSEFLPALRDELNRLLGHTQALPQLAALIVQGLQTFVTLASNCLLLACDDHFCPEYSPLTALSSVRRKSGQSLVDLFTNIELLMLQSKQKEQQGRDYIYTTLCNSDRQVVPDLHRFAVSAIEKGDQPWAPEVALAFDRACTNARAYARTVSERDRPDVLKLQTIAFTAGIIGLDQNLALSYRKDGRSPLGGDQDDPMLPLPRRSRGQRTRNTVAPVTTRSTANTQRQHPQLAPEAPSWPPPPPRPPPAPPLQPVPSPPLSQTQHLKPLDRTDRQSSLQPMEPRRAPAEPRRAPAAPHQVTTTNLWIDMMEVRRAAEESDPARRRLAAMIWPSDDCTQFASNIECKPTPVFENDGKPAYFNDGRPMVTFNHKKACRYCSVWAAQPGNLEEWRQWPQEVRDGQHNPKVCPRAIAQLLKAGNPGASFLKERWGKNKATRPEGNQRRAGQ